MNNFLSKIKFILRKPKIIVVTGQDRAFTKEAIFKVLAPYFKVGKEILIFEVDLDSDKEAKKFKFFVKNSSLPILVATSGKEMSEISQLVQIMSSSGFLIFNFDNEESRGLRGFKNLKNLSFGFQENADFRVSDVRVNGGVNFKINYKGNIVPIWLTDPSKEQIPGVLAAISVGITLGLNFVEVAEALKNKK